MKETAKKRGKVASILLAGVVALSVCFPAMALADTGHWFFSFQKGVYGTYCGPVMKSSDARYAYVSIRMSSDNVFTQGGSRIGLRVRSGDGANYATEYQSYAYYKENIPFKYFDGWGTPGYNYRLYGNVDSSSTTNLVQVWGYWTP